MDTFDTLGQRLHNWDNLQLAIAMIDQTEDNIWTILWTFSEEHRLHILTPFSLSLHVVLTY